MTPPRKDPEVRASKNAEASELRAEMDWDAAELRSGRPHGVVVSVRLDSAEADRLRALAAQLDMNMSQVLRRALGSFDSAQASISDLMKSLITASMRAYTFGGGTWVGKAHVRSKDEEEHLMEPPTETVVRQIRERIAS